MTPKVFEIIMLRPVLVGARITASRTVMYNIVSFVALYV